MKKKSCVKWISILIGAAALLADQASKVAIRNFMESRGGEDLVLIPGYLSIVHSYNTGVAFGMLQGAPLLVRLLPFAAVIVLLVIYMRSGENWGAAGVAGVGLLFGGACGNLVDRLMGGGRVFDFILAHAGRFYWPAFNAADSFILAGVFLFGIAVFRGEISE